MVDLKDLILKELNAQILSHSEMISNGQAQNMKEYGDLCGFVRGLREATNVVQDSWDNFIKQENISYDV